MDVIFNTCTYGYDFPQVFLRETKLNHTRGLSDIAYSMNASIEFPIKIQYGGHYE